MQDMTRKEGGLLALVKVILEIDIKEKMEHLQARKYTSVKASSQIMNR